MSSCSRWLLASCSLWLASAAQAAVDVGALGWTFSGVSGLIAADYQGSPDDRMLGRSPTGNANFAYLSTSGGVAAVSPLVLNDDDSGFNHTNGSRALSGSFQAQAGDPLVLYFNYVTTDGRGYDDYAWARLVGSDGRTAAWLFTARSGNAPDGDGSGDYVPGKVLSEQVGLKDLDSHDPDRALAAVLNGGTPVVGMPGGSDTHWAPLGIGDNGSYGWCWDAGSGCGSTGWIESRLAVAASGSYRLELGVINWGDTYYDSALAFDFAGLPQQAFGNTPALLNAAPVPEPSAWMLMLAGMGLVGTTLHRRRRPAA